MNEYWNTHLWFRGELPICVKCGESPISLGYWGDDDWKKDHLGHTKCCPITNELNFRKPELWEKMNNG